MRIWSLGLGMAAMCVLGCEKRSTDEPNASMPRANLSQNSSPIETSPEIQRDLLAIGREYSSWTLISDAARWAPTLCMPPRNTELHWSDSRDDGTHGRKLYYLRCNKPDLYDWLDRYADMNYRVPAGLTIVKEAHVPLEMPPSGNGVDTSEVLQRDGKSYQVGPAASLFVMSKYDEATPNTDRGWVYATLNADGTTITSAGAIESCIKCHAETPKDRLFGFSKH